MKRIESLIVLLFCLVFMISCSKHKLNVRVNHNKLLRYGETNKVKLFCGSKVIAETTITLDSTYFSMGKVKDGTYDIALYGRSFDSVAWIGDSMIPILNPVSQSLIIEIHKDLNFDFDFNNCK